MSVPEARATTGIFDPDRLRVARQLRKLSRAALARAIDVSPSAVGQWEAGDVKPKAQSLVQLAVELRFPVEYFAASGRPLRNVDTDCSFFRSLRKSRQVDREAAMAHAALIAELVRAIERHARLPELDIPEHPVPIDCPLEDIDTIAARVRAQWQLGDEPIEDVVRELERHGAVVVRLALADEGIDAFSWPAPDRPIVILGIDKGDRARSRFDAAHELGHLVMHRDHPRPADRELERQAHRFASAFLFPSDRIEAEWPPGRLEWLVLMEMKQRWGVSLAALLYRARAIGLISTTTYESATRYMSRAGWRRTEPGDLGPVERPRLLPQAAKALAEIGMGLAELAEEIHAPLEEVERYVSMPGIPTRVTVEI